MTLMSLWTHLSAFPARQRSDVTEVRDAAQLAGHGHHAPLFGVPNTLRHTKAHHHWLLELFPAKKKKSVIDHVHSSVKLHAYIILSIALHIIPPPQKKKRKSLKVNTYVAPLGPPAHSGSPVSPWSPLERRCTAVSAPGSQSFWAQPAADALPELSSCPPRSCHHLKGTRFIWQFVDWLLLMLHVMTILVIYKD